LQVVKNAKEEILFIFPTSNAFIRQERMGAITLAIEAAETHSVTVRILVPFSQSLKHRVQVLGLKGTEEGITKHNHNIVLRYIEQTSQAKARDILN